MEGFVDETTVEVSSGHGGAGSASFRRERNVPFGGPDGGDGGRGGDVVFFVKQNLRTLSHIKMKHSFKASNGGQGTGRQMHGRDGESVMIPVPPGTLIKDSETGYLIKDFTDTPDEHWVFLKGGKGGMGNVHFKSSKRQSPQYAQPGLGGESRKIRVELNIIADIGFVGFPNAGKSTLLTLLTNSTSKVAPYPFTTKIPHLGLLRVHDQDIVLADIPGIIEGAHEGHGLGIRFLKHIARTRGLAFLIDLSDETYLQTFTVLINELEAFSPELITKKRILIGSKTDLDEDGSRLQALKDSLPQETIYGLNNFDREQILGIQNAFLKLVSAT